MYNAIPLLGRVLLALIFVTSVSGKFGPGFTGTQQYMAAYGMSATAFWLMIGIILELGGAISVLLGVYARVGAGALILFLVPVTLIFHTNFSEQTQMIMFMKNVSITGGLLLLASFGAGEWALDRLWRK